MKHLLQTKKGSGSGGKISVGAAESFDSARKAIFHVSHLMSEKRVELGAPSVASAEPRETRQPLRNNRGRTRNEEEKWKETFLKSNSAAPDEMWCSKRLPIPRGSFSHCSGFRGVSDCVCQLTMGKFNSHRALSSGTDAFFFLSLFSCQHWRQYNIYI